MNIEIVTKDDLLAFKSDLLNELRKLFSGKADEEKVWLKSKEVRQMLNISNGTLQNLRVKGLLHPSKLAGIYYYKRSEIIALLNAGTGQ
jgi:hypothetical protein